MPKEKVYDKNLNTGFSLHVGWAKNTNYVSLATVNPNGGLLDEDGNPIAAIDPGWFLYLDRNGINELIRKLRKARDDSFGRDE